MIGNTNLRRTLICLILLIVSSVSGVKIAAASCEGFVEDLGQTFGVSIRKDKNGKVDAFFMVGESSFLVPKASLVRKAKKKAFMRGKADFSRFMKENFNATDLTSDLTNQIENTDQDGNTSGNVEEISSMVETMANNTEAVLSGIIVLGECVDTEQKLVMVKAGWKPALSAAAADAKQTIKKEVSRGDAPVSNGSGSSGKATPAKGYSIKSKNAKDF